MPTTARKPTLSPPRAARAASARYVPPADRADIGKSCRADTPRSSHGSWEPRADRPDPVVLLEEQTAQRVPELVPIRYGRMSNSRFAFYRGAAYVMASDLATTPRTGIQVQLCGDAHLANFGGFASAERQLLFDLNDFDETLPGPWEWDVKRLAASVAIAGRDNEFTDMAAYAALCAWTLARAHARSGDALAIAGYLGKSDVFDRAIAEFGEAYADQNERDYAVLLEAIATGRVRADVQLE